MRPTLFSLFKIVAHSSLPIPFIQLYSFFFPWYLSPCNILCDLLFKNIYCLSHHLLLLRQNISSTRTWICSDITQDPRRVPGIQYLPSKHRMKEYVNRFHLANLCYADCVWWVGLCAIRKNLITRLSEDKHGSLYTPCKEKYSQYRRCQLGGDAIKEYSGIGREV